MANVEAKTKVWKFPKTIGECADKLYTLREERLALQKKVDEMQAEETALKDHVINTLPKSQSTGVSGKVAHVSLGKKEVPQVKDWPAFYKFVKKTGQFDLMQKRLADAAVMERIEAGEKLPGVDIFTAVKVSVTKI